MTEQNRLIWRKNYKTQHFFLFKLIKRKHKMEKKEQNKTNSREKRKKESTNFHSSHFIFWLHMVSELKAQQDILL